jgi:hypothetical protein
MRQSWRQAVLVLGLATLSALAVTACGRGAASPRDPSPRAGSQERAAAEVVWSEPIDVARGEAYAGPWRMNDSDFRYVDDPTVTVLEDGALAVAWVDNGDQDAFFQIYDARGQPRFDAPVNVSRSPDVFSWLPRLIALSGEVVVLWQEIVFSGGSHGGEIFFSRGIDGGERFSEPINLSETTAGAGKGRRSRERWDNGSLDLARGPGDEIFAAWTEYEGVLRFSRSTDGGRTFSEPLRVDGSEARAARGPSLAAGADGVVHLAWMRGEERAANILLSRSTDGGRSFDAPRVAVKTDGYADAPAIAIDDEGRIHLAFTERPAWGRGRPHVRYTQASGAGAEFEWPETISGEAFAASFPSLALDGEGRVYVAWHHHPAAAAEARGLGFTFSRDGGEAFAPPSIVPGTAEPGLGRNGSRQGKLMRTLAVSDEGAIAVVSSHFRENEGSRVRLVRGRIDGGDPD